MSDIKVGDRVKVTIHEAVVTHTYGPGDIGLEIEFNGDEALLNDSYLRDGGATVEKIEPPVEVFGPGSLLRKRKDYGTSYWYLAPNGYVRLAAGDFTNATDFHPYGDNPFTSADYEKVEIDA